LLAEVEKGHVMQSIEGGYTLQPKMQAIVDGFEDLSDTAVANITAADSLASYDNIHPLYIQVSAAFLTRLFWELSLHMTDVIKHNPLAAVPVRHCHLGLVARPFTDRIDDFGITSWLHCISLSSVILDCLMQVKTFACCSGVNMLGNLWAAMFSACCLSIILLLFMFVYIRDLDRLPAKG